jgi:hypothetical protein
MSITGAWMARSASGEKPRQFVTELLDPLDQLREVLRSRRDPEVRLVPRRLLQVLGRHGLLELEQLREGAVGAVRRPAEEHDSARDDGVANRNLNANGAPML